MATHSNDLVDGKCNNVEECVRFILCQDDEFIRLFRMPVSQQILGEDFYLYAL